MPETTDYMIMGYVIGLGIVLLTVLSIWWRYRALRADEAAIEQLGEELREEQAQRQTSSEAQTVQ